MVIADEAGVWPSNVLINITAGSVVVAAEIFVATQTAATLTANSLAAGALKDAYSLEAVLRTQFEADGVSTATLSVEAIIASPSDNSVPIPVPDSSGNSGMEIAVAASAAGGTVLLTMVIIAAYYYHRKKKIRKDVHLAVSTSTNAPQALSSAAHI